MKTEKEIYGEMQKRQRPKLRRVPHDAYHAIHLVKPLESQFWYFWNYEGGRWDTYHADLSITVMRELIGFKGSQELTVLVHPVSK